MTDDLVQWLLDHGDAAIRYRTVTELMDGEDADLELPASGLAQYSMVHTWLDRLTPPRAGDLFSLHGSNPDAFENVCAKLTELGIRPGMLPEVDAGMGEYRRYLEQGGDFTCKPLVAACLNWAGYGGDEAVQVSLSERLDRNYELAQSAEYDIYIDHDTFGDCPAAFRKRPLVNPEYNGKLPGIWDVYALAHYPTSLMTTETRNRIEAVVAYILHPSYQALNEGYGYMRAGPRRYYSMGWSVHLPGYGGFEFARSGHAAMLVQRLELMAHFALARHSQWFRRTLDHLEGYRTEEGTYRFPANYLREQAGGYWVTGAYMRLEVNRRKRLSLEIESTFRMCKIKRLMDEEPGIS